MLDLFSGIGGISLAADWAGIETVAFCDNNEFCQKVLRKHWPDVPIFDDITKLNRQALIDSEVDVDGISIISGGWPCQPFSIAGNKKGIDDERFLWPEMLRLISEIRPTWVVGENVANYVNMELDQSLLDLESIGYKTQSFVVPACSVGAPHERNRLFVVGHSISQSELQANQTVSTVRSSRKARKSIAGKSRGKVARTYWETNQPPICGVDDGTADRFHKDRLIALGNMVVPQHIYPVFEAIMDVS